MEDSTYRKVLYYDLVSLYTGFTPVTVDVSKYKFMKGFAVRPGQQGIGYNDISVTYLNTSNLNFTITQQISNATTGYRLASRSIFGGGAGTSTSCFSTKIIPFDSAYGHLMCKAASPYDSWFWFPYRLLSLTFDAPNDNSPVNAGLMVFF